jgi:uncharacterized protein (DUF1330 family)
LLEPGGRERKGSMASYLIIDVDVHDSAMYQTYLREVPRLIAKHDGEYLVRGGTHEVLEGSWEPHRLVLLRFPSEQAVHDFVTDPEYEPLKTIREQYTDTIMLMVEGVEAQ